VANGDPGTTSGDHAGLGATFVARGSKERSIPASQFYKGCTTALAPA